MKISSHTFIKAVLIGGGLFAVLFAYRADNQKAAKYQDAFNTEVTANIKVNVPTGADRSARLSQQTPAQAETMVGGKSESTLFQNSDESEYQNAEFNSEFAATEQPDLPLLSLDDVTSPELGGAGPFAAEANVPQRDPVTVDFANEVVTDAFEDVAQESRIETNVDRSTPAQTVDFVERVPKAAPQIDSAPVALSDTAAQKAVHRIEYGKSLARRNATEAAGQEFLGALRVLAESNDMATGGNAHVRTLRRGLVAVKEAADFKVEDSQSQIVLNVGNIVESHETQIIGYDEAQTMTASAATRRYLEYAGHQLGTCGGQNPVAAEALYCLGKMKTIMSQSNPDPESSELYEAIIFHHASLTADPRNHRSANELGVLLARNGQLEAAETYLKNSLKIQQTAQAWANLAKVHQRKGTQEDQRLANLAFNEYQTAMYRQTPALESGPIQLVEPQVFIARSPVQSPEATQFINPDTSVVPVSNVESESPTFVERIGSLLTPGTVR
ncbi:tetratricopeptide repeat protein [Mariniblastus fucicola]|uniref:Tetratricopeptide repeat protein n=1 Tax=Mariniblastus fucicola TaxID=980251 RepID=A0A5B9PQZ1_9BACT|nr:hypothetical protein [Mariniblastus fucicola]QEG24733.1 hypothetical protein MFFC18_46550 [Mariniblastus fucicola]